MDDLIEPGAIGTKTQMTTASPFVDTEAEDGGLGSSSDEYSDEELNTGTGYSIRNKLGKYGEDSLYTKFAHRLADLLCVGDDDFFKDAVLVMDGKGNGMVFKHGEPLFAIVFGEITPERRGLTRLTAKGDKSGSNDKVVPRDRIRWRLGLRLPTEASRLLLTRFHGQLYELQKGITMLEGGDEAQREWLARGNKIRSWIHADPETGSENMIQLVTDTPIYTIPPSRRSVPLQQNNLDLSLNPISVEEARNAVQRPITLNTVYDANVLEDHSGPAFERHQGAQIPQKAFYDLDKTLITPWEVRSALRPGTLILAQVLFRRWNLTDADGRRIHSYQLQVSRIKVVAESPEEIEPYPERERPFISTIVASSMPGFDDFEVDERPSKRQRVK